MQWQQMKKEAARSEFEEWQRIDAVNPAKLDALWATKADQELSTEYRRLRTELFDSFTEASRRAETMPASKAQRYSIDLNFGLDLYRILNERGLTVRVASFDPVWLYVSMRVMPELIAMRYSSGASRLSPDRYYGKTRRIYPKCIWWYVHLSLVQTSDGCPDYEATRELLRNNTTDEIVQIVDRAGTGYRVDVTREIVKYYSTNRAQLGTSALRNILVQHVARANVVEPELALGGVPAYVRGLFEHIEQTNEPSRGY